MVLTVDGEDGREVLFQVAEGYIQWQYPGDTAWTNLVELAILVGPAGQDGANGKSAYELYIEAHPEYVGTEAEWLDDLVNDELGDKEIVTLTFNSNGGTDVQAQDVEKYTIAVRPEDPYKAGYEFLYWDYQGYEWIFFGYIVSDNIELVAQYRLVDFDIIYILDGGTNSPKPLTSYNVLTDTFSINNPSKEGFIFIGWTYEGQDVPVKKSGCQF